MSSSVLDQILAKLSPSTVTELSQKTGTPPGQINQAIQAALPMLLAALANNASRPAGAQALSQALDRDGHGDEDLETMFQRQITGAAAPQNTRMVDHMLGQRRGSIEQALAAKTGVEQPRIGQILEMLGPLVLGAVGKQKQSQGLDSGGLSDFLGKQKTAARQQSGDLTGSLFDLLDANDDGSVVDDVMRLAGQLLGNQKKPGPPQAPR